MGASHLGGEAISLCGLGRRGRPDRPIQVKGEQSDIRIGRRKVQCVRTLVSR